MAAIPVTSAQRAKPPNKTTVFDDIQNLFSRVSVLERTSRLRSASIGEGGLSIYDSGSLFFFLPDEVGSPGRIFNEVVGGDRLFLRIYAPATEADDNDNRISLEGSQPGNNGAIYLYSDGNIQLRVEDSGVKQGYILLSANEYGFDDPSAASGVNAQLVGPNSDGIYALTRPTSSLKYKQDIEDAEISVEEVLSLRPVTYREKSAVEADPDAAVHLGLIAEEVAQNQSLAPLVDLLDGEPDSVKYERLTVALLEVIKSQQGQIDTLMNRVSTLEEKVG